MDLQKSTLVKREEFDLDINFFRDKGVQILGFGASQSDFQSIFHPQFPLHIFHLNLIDIYILLWISSELFSIYTNGKEKQIWPYIHQDESCAAISDL